MGLHHWIHNPNWFNQMPSAEGALGGLCGSNNAPKLWTGLGMLGWDVGDVMLGKCLWNHHIYIFVHICIHIYIYDYTYAYVYNIYVISGVCVFPYTIYIIYIYIYINIWHENTYWVVKTLVMTLRGQDLMAVEFFSGVATIVQGFRLQGCAAQLVAVRCVLVW